MTCGFIDKLEYARASFGRWKRPWVVIDTPQGRQKVKGGEEFVINFKPLERVLYDKAYMKLNTGDGKITYYNDLPEVLPDCDEYGTMVLWYDVEDLYRALGGHAQ